MSEYTPNETSAQDQEPLGGDAPLEDEPIPAAAPDGEAAGGSARGQQWIAQLEAMIQQISTQAAPVAREVGAKAAELAAVAAVKAGPAAQKAAELTAVYGQKVAERAQAVAAELRSHDAGGAATTDATATDAPAPEGAAPEPAPGPVADQVTEPAPADGGTTSS